MLRSWLTIACYNSLITAAEESGSQETVRACQEILAEEKEMADWLDSQMPGIITEFLRMQE
jgi:ferritin-like metal-binding protein YciE